MVPKSICAKLQGVTAVSKQSAKVSEPLVNPVFSFMFSSSLRFLHQYTGIVLGPVSQKNLKSSSVLKHGKDNGYHGD